MLAPAIFLGKLTHPDFSLSEEYFTQLGDFFTSYRNNYFIWVESTDLLKIGEYNIHYGSEEVKHKTKKALEPIMNAFCSKNLEINSLPEKLEFYLNKTGIKKENVISITINETKPQTLMDIGKSLTELRKEGFLLIGLGNITQKNQITEEKPLESVLEFDSWVRVKLWEFDYYALRDIDNIFPFQRGLYQDKKQSYSPFLIVFGSLEGTDVLYDLFSGFEGNNSLRSFYFKELVNN